MVVALGLVASLSGCQPQGEYQPLWLQLVNRSGQTLTRVTIAHGNNNTEEQISVLQLAPDGQRTLALNHQPAQGFSLTVYYQDGRQFEMCVGKYVNSPVISEIILPDGLEEVEGRVF